MIERDALEEYVDPVLVAGNNSYAFHEIHPNGPFVIPLCKRDRKKDEDWRIKERSQVSITRELCGVCEKKIDS